MSLGAVTVLMVLIRQGSAAAATSQFSPVPPASALMGWLAVGETSGLAGILGLLFATAGVWQVNLRPKSVRFPENKIGS